MAIQKKSNDRFIHKLNEIIESNIQNERFGSSELANEMGMSRSNLHRKLISITKLSTSQYLRQYRLKKAMEMLRQSSLSISEVAYQTGFSSPSYFTKCFHDYYGYVPGEVGTRENSENIDAGEHTSLIRKIRPVIILTSIMFVVIAIIYVVSFGEGSSTIEEFEKTIAVLPFIDDSPKTGNSYIINGLMDQILDKLQKINGFDVKSRTDSEKYRESKKSIRQIAEELQVNYIIEGSGQKIQDKIRLRVQLVEAITGNHLWSKTFTEDSEDIFKLQEKVALSVASALKTELSSEEKEHIQKLPTANKTAYNFYLQGMEYFRIAELNENVSNWPEHWKNAEKGKEMFMHAIQLDTTFSDAYLQLSVYFLSKKYYENLGRVPPNVKRMILDSGYYYAAKTLDYDPGNIYAKVLIKGYYEKKGLHKEAEKIGKQISNHVEPEFKKYQEQTLYFCEQHDFYNAIKSYLQYKIVKPKDIVIPKYMFSFMIETYRDAGFFDASENEVKEMLTVYPDSIFFYTNTILLEIVKGDMQNALKIALKANERLSKGIVPILTLAYIYNRDFPNAYKYSPKPELKADRHRKEFGPDTNFGLVYLKNGMLSEAEKHFIENAEIHLGDIHSNLLEARTFESHFYIAMDYFGLGKKEEAFEYLKAVKQAEFVPYGFIADLKYWPGFDEVRDDPVFVDVLNTLDAKFQKEKKRIEKLLKDQGESY
jgi:TolB-like protein/AraC-like DNA-binding protein